MTPAELAKGLDRALNRLRKNYQWCLAIAFVLTCQAISPAMQKETGSEQNLGEAVVKPIEDSSRDERTEEVPEEVKVQPLEGDAREEAVGLIRQLADPDFNLRQEASRKLWKIGPPVVEMLQRVIDGGVSSESRMRAKDLVTLIKAGVTHDSDAEIVRCVVGFLDREILVQGRAIQKLCFLDQRRVARKLIAMVPSESERETLLTHCSVAASDAEVALRLGDWDKFREWINDPATRESNQLLYHYNLWVEGKLEAEIDWLRGKADLEIAKLKKYDADKKAKEAKQKKAKKKSASELAKKKKEAEKESAPPQPRLQTLIGLLRFLERWEEATEYADKVYDRKKRKTLMHSILMESGNWKRLASLIVEPDGDDSDPEDDPHDGLGYPAESYDKALIEFYAGNEKDFSATVDEIEAKIEEENRKKKRRGATETEGNSSHAQFLRYTLDFDSALKYTALKKNSATFRMLSGSRRYKKLFDVFNLQTYEKRERYFKGRIRHIRSLQRRVEHFTKNGNPEFEDQKENYIEKRDSEIEFYRSVVNLLATLGMDVEAELYLRKLFFEFSDEIANLGARTVLNLQQIGAFQSAWDVAEIEYQRDTKLNLTRSLFNPQRGSHEAAVFLDLRLKTKIEDSMERYRKIAMLIKSPMDLSGKQIDFWQEVADVDFSKNSKAIKYLFSIWGLEDEQFFQNVQSADAADSGLRLLKEGNYLLAAQKFEAAALNEGYPVHYAQAWHAYQKGGNADKAKQMRLLFALKFDPDDAYDYTGGFAGTQWQSMPLDAYRLHDCLENPDIFENCYYMWRITKDDSLGVLSHHQKMVRTQILRLRYIDSPYLDGSEEDHPRFIAGSLNAGDLDGAKRWFKKLSTYSPADSGFVEKNFPTFEKNENDEFMDEIFQNVSKDFYEILEAFPDSAMYLNNYGWSCACAKRNVVNGIEFSKRAVELRPGTAGYLDTLATLYHVNGDHELAIETIRRAIEINPMRDYYREQLEKFREAAK